MISFYDWAPSSGNDGTNGYSAGRRPATEEDERAKADTEFQAKLCQKIQDAVDISDVFNKVAIHTNQIAPKTLAFAVHRIARYCRLRRQDTGPTKRAARWASLLRQVQSVLPSLEPQALTDVTWSLAVLNHRDAQLLSAICHQAFNRIEEYSPANLAITAWSFATLGYRDDLVMKRINRQVLVRLPEFEAQSLANVSWALATSRFKDDVLLHKLAIASLGKMHAFSAQHVANTAWAYATLGRRAGKLFDALEDRAVELLQDPDVDFHPLDLALCSWSFAWLEHASKDSKLLRSIVPVAVRRIDEFSTQQLANMLWGFDHANYVDSGFYATIGKWCAKRPDSYWNRAAGEELVSILTALKPFATDWNGWSSLEEYFLRHTVRPLAGFLRESNSSEGYTEGLRKLRTYHAGALYTENLFKELGIEYLGDGWSARTRQKVDSLVAFYAKPPEPRWLPDGYGDDDEQACRAEIPSLLELLEVKRRVQPSSHFIALHLSADLTLEGEVADGSTPRSVRRSIWRTVPTRPPRRSGLSFVRGQKFEEQDLSGDEGGKLRTSTLRDYQRKHHAEVTAMSQIADTVQEMEEELTSGSSAPSSVPASQRVTGFVELFVPHYPCSSCTGALVHFSKLYPRLSVRVGHDDWRHWIRKLDAVWDKSDKKQQALSINARQLYELDNQLGDEVPEAYRLALRATLGEAGVVPSTLPTEGTPTDGRSPATALARTINPARGLENGAAMGAAAPAVQNGSSASGAPVGTGLPASSPAAKRQSFY
eukprot:TRINITY_DN70732_c0_g1_i1.p1 TRINITY_DN70732_c0_g1~~TRINITY_DN70732_c0_g1_i1.p1  ORF type:complete len:767 (-),score=88.77 TRINITY_DN70732_c0_g1_i1:8-2308(-)